LVVFLCDFLWKRKVGSLPSSSFWQWFDGFTLVALLLWRCGGWSKGSSFMWFLMENEVFSVVYKVVFLVYIWFSFGVQGCGVNVHFLWGFWWKGKTFIWFHVLIFLLRYDFCHFESVFFLNEWWVGGWFGWFLWIVCLHELVVLFKCLKVTTFMAEKWIIVHVGQSNEYMNTSDLVAKTSTMVSLD